MLRVLCSCADLTDPRSVWDWIKRKRLNRFFNGNPRGTSITSLHLINQDVGGIILTGAGASTLSHVRSVAAFVLTIWFSGRHDSTIPQLRLIA